MGFAPDQEPQVSKGARSFSFPRAPAQRHTATLPGRAAPRQVEEPDQAPQAAPAYGIAVIAQAPPGHAPPPSQANGRPYGPDGGEVCGPDDGLVRVTTWEDNASPKIKVWSQTEPGACMNPGGFELPNTWEPPATGRTATGAGAAQWPSMAVSIALSSDLGGPAGGAWGAPLPAPIRLPGGQAEGGQGSLAGPAGLRQGLRAEAEPYNPNPNPDLTQAHTSSPIAQQLDNQRPARARRAYCPPLMVGRLAMHAMVAAVHDRRQDARQRRG